MLAHSFGPLVEAVWVARHKRFMLDVTLPDGTSITAHCPNTGAMTGLCNPGARVLLSVSDNPKRRYQHTLEAVQADGVWVGVNTQNPNRVALAMARAGRAPFPATGEVRPEVRYGKAERIDILVTHADGRRTFVEIKNVHLLERPGAASFPDSVTARGAKHLGALADVAATGDDALMVFLIQRGDVETFELARHIDPAYGAAFDAALAAGVRFAALRCAVSPEGIHADRLIPIRDMPDTLTLNEAAAAAA